MKLKILTSILLALSTSASAYATELKCINDIFRQAHLIVDSDKSISVQDSWVGGNEELRQAIQEEFGLSQGIMLRYVRLHWRGFENSCDLSNLPLMSCEGQPEFATLTVSGWISGARHSAAIELDVSVPAPQIRISSQLESQGGPHEIGAEGPTTISLDTLVLEAEAEVELGSRKVRILWTPFFRYNADDHGSHCQSQPG